MIAEETAPAANEFEEPEKKPKSDPELKAMTMVVRALQDLDKGAQSRVVTWIYDRFGHLRCDALE